MVKNHLWPFVVVGLCLANHAQAQIGRTLDECKQSYGYGEAVTKKSDAGDAAYAFYPEIESRSSHKIHYAIVAFFIDGKVSTIHYWVDKSTDKTDEMYVEDAKYLLQYCPPEVVWTDPSYNAAQTEMTWSGSVNGVVTYTARLKGTYSLEIADEATNVGGVMGAKREIINGQSVTVLPLPEH